jgi:hypothetical protein
MVKSKPSNRKRPLEVTTTVSTLFLPPSSKAHDINPCRMHFRCLILLGISLGMVYLCPANPLQSSVYSLSIPSIVLIGPTLGVAGLLVLSLHWKWPF